jgi:hypothetical protein
MTCTFSTNELASSQDFLQRMLMNRVAAKAPQYVGATEAASRLKLSGHDGPS